ncbi:uncharacterized protein LOC129303443 [Prosopis cineraria]|uniref:uncharacterized protein LOC129303443 n=1 Tax=Prosopis cineraria TaxID=364024 RepID=UPI00240FB8D5|nr:uncharacterized protein LOC129303443 [Prosopis cineraria]
MKQKSSRTTLSPTVEPLIEKLALSELVDARLGESYMTQTNYPLWPKQPTSSSMGDVIGLSDFPHFSFWLNMLVWIIKLLAREHDQWPVGAFLVLRLMEVNLLFLCIKLDICHYFHIFSLLNPNLKSRVLLIQVVRLLEGEPVHLATMGDKYEPSYCK